MCVCVCVCVCEGIIACVHPVENMTCGFLFVSSPFCFECRVFLREPSSLSASLWPISAADSCDG